MSWATEEARDQIAVMLAEGLTGAQIAHRFGVTRNAVIGIIHRDKRLKAIGFKRSPGPQNTEKARDIRVEAKRRKNVRGGTVSLNKIKAARAIVALLDEAPDIPGRFGAPHVAGIDLMMLTECRCKWPINDGGPFLFCGMKKQPDRPYCAFHATASLGNGTESERTAIRSALKIAA
jgi:hypothetical protein